MNTVASATTTAMITVNCLPLPSGTTVVRVLVVSSVLDDSIGGGPVATSPGQPSSGTLEATSQELPTESGRNCTGIVIPEEAHSWMIVVSRDTFVRGVP